MKALAVIDVIDFPDYVYDNCPTKDQLDSITRKEDEWEIPSFMLKETNDS